VACYRATQQGAALIDTRALTSIMAGMSSAGQLRQLHSRLYLFVGGRWTMLKAVDPVRTLLCDVVAVAVVNDPDTEYLDWFKGNTTAENDLAMVIESRSLELDETPHSLARSIVGEQYRPYVKEAVGILQHPVYGMVAAAWLLPPEELYPIPEETDYSHIKNLFSGMDLSPASHAAAYCFLLGGLHADSLTVPRPVLVVDSWQQARGKSEICLAISTLLDDEAHAIADPKRETDLHDELVAGLRDGRTITIDNVDGKGDYNPDAIATASTGTLKIRHKYDSGTTKYSGLLVMLNLVYGASSFHPDIVSRGLRCELTGPSVAIKPQPRDYARDYRTEILGEIIHALTNCEQDYKDASSRFREFDTVALPAYAHIFDITLEEAAERLAEARHQMRAFSMPVVTHFAGVNPTSAVLFKERALDRRFIGLLPDQVSLALTLPPEYNGVQAMGKTLTNGEWK